MVFKEKKLSGRFKRLYNGLITDGSYSDFSDIEKIFSEYDNCSLKDSLNQLETMNGSGETVKALYNYLNAAIDKDNELREKYLKIKSALKLIYREKSSLVYNLKVLKKYIDKYNEVLEEYKKL